MRGRQAKRSVHALRRNGLFNRQTTVQRLALIAFNRELRSIPHISRRPSNESSPTIPKTAILKINAESVSHFRGQRYVRYMTTFTSIAPQTHHKNTTSWHAFLKTLQPPQTQPSNKGSNLNGKTPFFHADGRSRRQSGRSNDVRMMSRQCWVTRGICWQQFDCSSHASLSLGCLPRSATRSLPLLRSGSCLPE